MKNLLIKASLIALLPFAISSCSSDAEEKDDQFCKCLQVTEELNDFSSKLFDREVTKEDVTKMVSLKEAKKKECKDYQEMSGEEMLKRKELCN